MKLIQKLTRALINLFFSGKEPQEPQTIREEFAGFKEYQLEDLVMLTGLSRKKIKAIAKYYNLSYSDLLSYYLYFNKLPKREHALIIRHFGADHIIYITYSSATPEEDLKKDYEYLIN